jgi:protein TonB
MSGLATNAGWGQAPTPVSARRAAGGEDLELVPVITLVIWLGCLAVGILGLTLAYPGPRAVVSASSLVPVQLLDVELASVPLAPPEALPSPAPLAEPSPAPRPAAVPEAAPLVAVAAPSAPVAFALPVEAPAKTAPIAEATHSRPGTAAVVLSPLPAPQSLTFGVGEGKQPAPSYPLAAVRAGQEGTVRVGFTVGEDGHVVSTRLVSASPWTMLNNSALQTIRYRWRFKAGAVRRYEVSIHFQLQK